MDDVKKNLEIVIGQAFSELKPAMLGSDFFDEFDVFNKAINLAQVMGYSDLHEEYSNLYLNALENMRSDKLARKRVGYVRPVEADYEEVLS